MKKVFFTAIALVAMSSASMANTIADEEVIVENKKEVKEEANLKYIDPFWLLQFSECIQVYQEIKDTYTPLLGSTAATSIAFGGFRGCMQ